MKKYSIGIVLAVGVGFLVWWLGGAPETVPVSDTTTPPPSISESADSKTTSIEGTKQQQQPQSPVTTNQPNSKKMTIQTTKEGTGPSITNGQTAEVHYVGKLTDGTTFDASKPRGSTFSFKLGAGQVIKGWDEGVLGMKVGEVRTLTIPPELGYGAAGAGGVIPPNATLIFEVELIAIK